MPLEEARAIRPTPTQLRLSRVVATALREARVERALGSPRAGAAAIGHHLLSARPPLHQRPWKPLSPDDWAMIETGSLALPGAVIREAIRTIRLLQASSPGYTMMVRWKDRDLPDEMGNAVEDVLGNLTADFTMRSSQSGEWPRFPPDVVLRCFDMDLLTSVDDFGRRETVMSGGTGVRALDTVILEQIGPYLSPLSHGEIRDAGGTFHLAHPGGRSRISPGPDPHLERQRLILAPLADRPAGTREAFDWALESSILHRTGDDERAARALRDRIETALARPGMLPESVRVRLIGSLQDAAPAVPGAHTDRPTLAKLMSCDVQSAVDRYLTRGLHASPNPHDPGISK